MKKIIATVVVFTVIIGLILGAKYYYTKKKYDEYLSCFLQYTKMAVEGWEQYEKSNDILYYQHGAINFYIAVDYFERYSYAKMDGFSHEFMALNTIRLDMYSDVTVIKPYLSKLKEALTEFDEAYQFGSQELFIPIFEIEKDIQLTQK